jgi:NAD(P)H-hydrate epimerase
MREIDRRAIEEYGVPSPALMENAGRAVADAVRALDPMRRRVLLVCGRGNNGGDGFVAARHLANGGFEAMLLLAEGEPRGDAELMARSARRMCAVVSSMLAVSPDLIVDALYGTGLTRPVEGPARELIRRINGAQVPVVAVDVPSGLDADTGRVLGEAVRATVTVTMGLPKVGFERAAEYVGRLVVADIGIPRALLESPPPA